MFHVDNNSAVPVMPAVKPVVSAVTSFFTEGGNGVPPTYPGPDWFNIIQSELLAILAAAGISPDKASNVQLLAAMRVLFLDASQNGADIQDKAAFLQNLQLRESFSGVVGQSRNARMSVTSATQSATFTSDELIVETSTGQQYRLSAFSKVINIGTTGAGGMDIGLPPTTGFVAIYAIYNPTTATAALLAVNTTTYVAPQIYGGSNMPSGYTASALVSVWWVSSSQLMPGVQSSKSIAIADRSALNTTVPATSLTALSLSSIIPQNAKTVSGYGLVNGTTIASNNSFALASTSTGLGYKPFGANNSGIMGSFDDLQVYETQKIYYLITSTSSISGAAIQITGYTI